MSKGLSRLYVKPINYRFCEFSCLYVLTAMSQLNWSLNYIFKYKKPMRTLTLLFIFICLFNFKIDAFYLKGTNVEIDTTLIPKEIEQYGQFVGEWECEVSNLQKDGTWSNSKASWRFDYILGGTAVQDFWTNPANTKGLNKKEIMLGTNIRTFNPRENIWECIWLENRNKTINGIWKSHEDENNDILLYDETENWLITFYNITENSFDWKWDFKQADGSMKTMSKMKATRK